VGGAIQFTNRNREAAAEKIRGDRIGMCVDAARRHLLSRLTVSRSSVETLKDFQVKLLDSPDVNARTEMRTAHYDDLAVPQVTVVDVGTVGASSGQAVSVGNVSRKQGTVGGDYYRVVIKCQEPSDNPAFPGRESEVEFLFRYGI